MKKRIVVAGVGSAGILSLSHICGKFDNSWDIVSIHDPNQNVLGIGESTNPTFLHALDIGTGLNLYDGSIKELDATLKLGTRYVGWRKEPFYSPLLSGGIAIHFNSSKLETYATPRLKERWPEKFKKQLGKIEALVDRGDHVEFYLNGELQTCDYFIDCRGFPEDYSDYNMSDAILVNHALVHNKNIPGDWTCTDHVAHKNGWMFGIPLTSRQSFGYLFNDRMTTVEDAKKDFSAMINVPLNDLQGIEYKFNSYYAKSFLNNRIIKNGNRALFFEPIGTTSIYSYQIINMTLTEYILKKESVGGMTEEECKAMDEVILESIRKIEDLISYFYHGGSQYDSEFWRTITQMSRERLRKSLRFNRAIATGRIGFKKGLPFDGVGFVYPPTLFSVVDKAFEYNYLSSDQDIF